MNFPECARRRDLLLGAVRWAAATDEPGWVMDPKSGIVHLTPRLQNLLRWPTSTASAPELAGERLPLRAIMRPDGRLTWSDSAGLAQSRSERLVVHDCCPSCQAAPIEIGLLHGLSVEVKRPLPELVAVGASVANPTAEPPHPAAALEPPPWFPLPTPELDPFRARLAKLAELYADIPPEFREHASRRHRHRSTVSRLWEVFTTGVLVVLVVWVIVIILGALLSEAAKP